MVRDKKHTENPFHMILKKAATEKWGKSLVEEILPALKSTADAIWEIENYQLTSEEEPAFTKPI